MITFFTIVRPFVGEFDRLQRAAIGSWQGAVPECEVLVFGDREGAGEACAALGATHVPKIATNAQGTELVADAFSMAEELAGDDLLCEVSADIVLGADFLPALRAIAALEHPFVVGQRWDIDPGQGARDAQLHPPCGIDYFVYRRGTLGDIPPFAVGRTLYDNWLIWAAMHRWGLQVIDATQAITAIHVNHGYGSAGKAAVLAGEEVARNAHLFFASGAPRPFGTNDAPWVLAQGRVRKRG